MRVIAKLDVKPPHVVKPVHFEGLRKVGTPGELAARHVEDLFRVEDQVEDRLEARMAELATVADAFDELVEVVIE